MSVVKRVVHRLRNLQRPASATVSSACFSIWLTFSTAFLYTFVEPLFVVGDFNVHLERPTDPSVVQLVDLFAD